MPERRQVSANYQFVSPGALAERLGPEVFGRILARAMTLPDTYLHWDELRHREPPEGLDHEAWWFSLKRGRMRGARPLPLRDGGGRPFLYTLPNQALAQLHLIDSQARGRIRLDEQITGPETRDRYIVSSLMEEAITSSQLEGASTTRKVAVEMLRTGRKPRDQSERMIANNYAAMQFIHTLKGIDLTPETVLELHRIVTLDTLEDPSAAGRLQRPGEKRVRISDDRDGTLLHTPPPAEQLPERLEALCEFANRHFDEEDFIPPVIHAIVLHFWLAYDHPFEDGNGRTGRALFYWSMLRHGYGRRNTCPFHGCCAGHPDSTPVPSSTRKRTTTTSPTSSCISSASSVRQSGTWSAGWNTRWPSCANSNAACVQKPSSTIASARCWPTPCGIVTRSIPSSPTAAATTSPTPRHGAIFFP